MRTTLTLDDDVARFVQEEVRRSGGTFKGTVNTLLRRGLNASRNPRPRRRFVVTPRKMGLPPGLSYDSIPELLEAIEGPYHR
ncbi:MAG: hypothetical protein WBE72_02020 [Terracidiphilus sp.]